MNRYKGYKIGDVVQIKGSNVLNIITGFTERDKKVFWLGISKIGNGYTTRESDNFQILDVVGHYDRKEIEKIEKIVVSQERGTRQ